MKKLWNGVLLVPSRTLKMLLYNLINIALVETKHNNVFSHYEFPCSSISVFFIVLEEK